jgi:chemotaxis protein methyltransferase CheR
MATLTSNPLPSAAEYEFIRQLVFKHSRIHLGADKQEMALRRLQLRLKATGLVSCKDYYDYLMSPGGEEELTDLIDFIVPGVRSPAEKV